MRSLVHHKSDKNQCSHRRSSGVTDGKAGEQRTEGKWQVMSLREGTAVPSWRSMGNTLGRGLGIKGKRNCVSDRKDASLRAGTGVDSSVLWEIREWRRWHWDECIKSVHSLESLHYQQQTAQTEKQAILEHKQELWKWQRKDRETHRINFLNLCFFFFLAHSSTYSWEHPHLPF